jgi:hypothetical protein
MHPKIIQYYHFLQINIKIYIDIILTKNDTRKAPFLHPKQAYFKKIKIPIVKDVKICYNILSVLDGEGIR